MRISTASRLAAVTALLVLLLAGCSQKAAPTKELTERQRDSTLGASGIPGAFVVTRALDQSDRSAGAAHQMDAQVDSIGR
jgi:PBP1b-binding outer membrane lipoprotein LpoB